MSLKPALPLPPRPNRPWIDTASIRNALAQNHFIDLLSTLTAHHPHKPDTSLPSYIPAGAYALRMRKISSEYKRQVASTLARALPPNSVTLIPTGPQQRSSTLNAMAQRTPLIVGAVLADHTVCIQATIPILLRVDVATQLFPVTISAGDSEYVAVAVKRRPVDTYHGLLRPKCLPRVQAELWVWNRLLAATQALDIGCALLIGLNPNRNCPIPLGGAIDSAKPAVFDSAIWTIAQVPMTETSARIAMDALRWRVHVVDKGEAWIRHAETGGHGKGLLALAASADDVRMRPNMKCASMYDWPWAHAKRSMAMQLCDLTLVSGVSQKVAEQAMKRGLPNNYADERVTAKALGVDSHFTAVTLTKCKHSYNGPLITPHLIPHNRFNWRALQNFDPNNFQKFDKNGPKLPRAEERSFYIDFELASPEYLYSDSSPDDRDESGHQVLDLQPSSPAQEDMTPDSLIFMIGCGRVINGEWKHDVFTADGISRVDESAVVRKWLEHMHRLRPANFGSPILFVWGPEQQLLKKAFRRMTPEDLDAVKDIKHYKHVNMLQVASTACLSIKGALNNSVKTVATALEKLGVLGDFDGRPACNGVQDGADAMALALDAVEQVKRKGLPTLADAPNMKRVASYNEADCRDIARIVVHLRENR